MFRTAIAGSLPKPAWLAETQKLWPEWKQSGDALLRAKADATLLWVKLQEDAGMEVIYSGRHNSPESLVEVAIQEDVDVVGLSILSGAHMTLFPRVRKLLLDAGRNQMAEAIPIGRKVRKGPRPTRPAKGGTTARMPGRKRLKKKGDLLTMQMRDPLRKRHPAGRQSHLNLPAKRMRLARPWVREP